MFKNENQFSRTASQLSIDEAYTNFDIDNDEIVSAREGYTFKYPQRWLSDPSLNKAIGIRRLNIIPTSHTFTLTLSVKRPKDAGAGASPSPRTLHVRVMRSNTTEEILSYICEQFTTMYNSDNKYTLIYTLNDDGSLNFECYLITSDVDAYSCEFTLNGGDEEGNSIYEFLRFLNQETNETNRKILTRSSKSKKFDNVWDRSHIEFHASFSDAKYGFIGCNNDFYYKPNVLFNPPTDGPVFKIRFTIDGKKHILPLYCRFIVQLTFILNYMKNITM